MKRILFGLLACLSLSSPALAGLTLEQLPSRGAVMYLKLGDGTFVPMAGNSDGSTNASIGGSASYTTTEKGGTLTLGGTAQPAIASNASRKVWCIQNDPAASENLFVRLNGTASATAGIVLQPGQQACNPSGITDTAVVSVFAATTGHRWFGFEGQ